MNQPIVLFTLHAGYHHSSLALRSIRAACRTESFAGRILVEEHQLKGDHAAIVQRLRDLNPAVLACSCYLWNIDALLAVCAELKASHANCRMVLGGPEAGPRAADLLTLHPCVDYVIDGEGELAFRDLCRHFYDADTELGAVSGLHWRSSQGAVENNAVALVPVTDIPGLADHGPLPDRDLVYWETSRGCPFHCSFCTSSEEMLRQFPMERIEADLAVLGRLTGRTVKLLDRSFHLGRTRTLDLLHRFLETPDSLRFHLELNPDRISDEALAIFARATPGKFQFEVGLQTLNPDILRRIHREMDVERAMRTLSRLIGMHRHPVHLDLIVGLPGETEASCRDSLDRVFRLHPDHLQLGLLKLLPGTPLRREAVALGYQWVDRPPYQIESGRELSAAAFSRFADFAELLERLWNTGWLRNTLPFLVEHRFDGSVSALLARLREAAPELLRRPPAQEAFARVIDLFADDLERNHVLRELLLWDYARHCRPGRQVHPWVRDQWQIEDRLPLVTLSPQTAHRINLLQSTPLHPGSYRVEMRHHLKGRPVSVHPVSAPGHSGRA